MSYGRVILLRWANFQRRVGVRVPSMWTCNSTFGRLAMNGVISRPFMMIWGYTGFVDKIRSDLGGREELEAFG